MSDITLALQLAFDKLGELATTYGPPAINTAAEVVRIGSIRQLAVGAVALITAAVIASTAFPWALKSYRKGQADAKAKHDASGYKGVFYGSYDGVSETLVAVFAGAATVALTITAIFNLLDIWAWVALFNPKLALAAKLVHALPGFGS